MLKTSGMARLEERRSLSAQGYVSGVAWSADGKRIAGLSDFGRKVAVWAIDGARVAVSDRRGPYVESSIALLSNDTVLTAVSNAEQMEQGSAFCAWNVVTGSIVSVKGPEAAEQSPVERFAVAADGETLAAMNGSQIALLRSKFGTPPTAPSRPHIPVTLAPIRQRSWRPDSRYLAAAAGDNVVRVYSPAILTRAVAVSAQYGEVDSVAFSPDGSLLAAATDDGVTLFALPRT
jgi:WD40 repeat protein